MLDAALAALRGGGGLTPQMILAVQRLAGNAAVDRLLAERRQAEGHTEQQAVQASSVHQVLASPGRPLEPPVRADMQERFGADLSDVRVHTGDLADRATDSVAARAFTAGSHMVFGKGSYDTGSLAGRHLLAHEVTHVLQQRGGPVAGTPTADGLAVSDPADRFEREAEATAAAVLSAPASVPPTIAETSTTAGWSAARLVQRVVKASIPQPGAAEQSAVVPDLPAALVQQIQAAGTADERRQVLAALTNYVWAQLGSQAEDLQARVVPTYVNRATGPGGALALTHEQLGTGDPDSPPIRLSIYRGAFDRGPAVLYSTLRHELIHAMQRSMVPDEGEASAEDEFMFENLYPPNELGPATRNTLQLPLQEIETHVWELVHAAETGVDQAYRTETVEWLIRYTDNLIGGIRGATADQFSYWRHYLTRAESLLAEAAAALDEDAAAQVNAAAGRLAAAIAGRAAVIAGSSAAGSSADTGRRGHSPEHQSRSSKRKKTA
jgi:hypothetical protein